MLAGELTSLEHDPSHRDQKGGDKTQEDAQPELAGVLSHQRHVLGVVEGVEDQNQPQKGGEENQQFGKREVFAEENDAEEKGEDGTGVQDDGGDVRLQHQDGPEEQAGDDPRVYGAEDHEVVHPRLLDLPAVFGGVALEHSVADGVHHQVPQEHQQRSVGGWSTHFWTF